VSSDRAGELLVLGISHNTAPVALRERLALTDTAARAAMQELVGVDAVDEAVVISTCNRTETYLVVRDAVQAETELLGHLARRAGIRPTELASIVYSPRNCDAARQLFSVTSGLDSMIIGEAEVQGQVKRAYENALATGTTGPLTNRMFSAALKTGKRVRSETGIGSSHVSVSTVAVQMAREAVGDLADSDVVLIGAGETSELTARALAAQGVSTIFVANRRADRALSLAERFGGTVVSLDELPTRLEHADIVVSSTSSPHPIVGVEEMELVVAARGGRPIVLIDIAVPRDIEAACGDLPGVTLLDIDDLQAAVQRNLSVREGERERAAAIVEEEIQRFARWMGQLDVRPTIRALRSQGDTIVEQVLAENSERWESLSARDRARVEALARAVMQRALHEPTLRLKALADDHASGHGRLQIARELFGLEPGSASAADADADATVTPIDERRRSSLWPRCGWGRAAARWRSRRRAWLLTRSAATSRSSSCRRAATASAS
jgi:glutamyl-tRNA reductase